MAKKETVVVEGTQGLSQDDFHKSMNPTVKVNPYLKTVLFTPGVDTGEEASMYTEDGQLDVYSKTDTSPKSVNGVKVHRWGLPLILSGSPGTGKSSQIKAISKAVGLKCMVQIASLCEPQDFKGIPIPRELRGTSRDGSAISRYVVDYAPPAVYMKLAELGGGVLFLDEISTAPPSVQAALLRLVLDGVVGDFKLPSRVRFLAAMNPVDESAGGWDLSMPLANRFGHLRWSNPNVGEWTEWLLSQKEAEIPAFSAEAEEARVLKLWPNEFAKAKGLVSGFLSKHTSPLLKVPKSNDPNASQAWPSPRSWESAIRVFAGANIHGLDESQREQLVASFVGDAASQEFHTFLKNADLPDPILVLDGKETFTHNPKKLDRTYAALTSMAAIVTLSVDKANGPAVTLRDNRANHLWGILGDLHDKCPDIVVPVTRVLLASKLVMMPNMHQLLLKINPMLNISSIKK